MKKMSVDDISGKIQISGAFALYPMVVKWAEEFKKLHPKVDFDISGGGAGKGMTDVLSGLVDIGMISREILPEEVSKGAFVIASVRDAVVPTINVNNPDLGDILSIGLTKEVAQKIWTGKFKTWGDVLGTSSKNPIHVYTRSDACGAAETWASWFNLKQENLKAIAIFGDPGIANAVQKDEFGIGFNNMSYAYDKKTKKPFNGLVIVPLNIRENGKIDKEENFYNKLDNLVQAIKNGDYPSPPSRDLYLVTKGKPKNKVLIAFLMYVLSKGQKYTDEVGYVTLGENRLDKELSKIK